jgi:carboxypeptidase C (cathepsin A)
MLSPADPTFHTTTEMLIVSFLLSRRPAFIAAIAALSLTFVPCAVAQERRAANPEQKEEASKDLPIPPETTSITQHQQSIGGQTIHYTATAGNLLIGKEDHDQSEKPYHSVFYIAYTQDGADAKTRPVTFLYNGGPGSATIWLEMGSVGPVRVLSQSPEPSNNPPFQVVPNEYSLLDKTDLVFIDAPGTGYSHPVGKGTVKDIAGVDEDLRAFTRFIIRYISVNHRWNSPKFLFGESYGTTRSAGLSATLNEAGVQLNGIVLLSSILNYNARSAGLDNEYITDLPTFAAIAYYHNKVPNKPADILSFVEQARVFARGPYAEALYLGNALSEADADKIAGQLSGFTGLSVKFIKDANVRVSPTRFRKELLRDQNKILGRYDGRFEGPDADAAGENPGYDPSDTSISGAYVASFHDYLEKDLKFVSQETYNNSGPGINENWDWTHRAAGASGFGRQQRMPYVAGDLGDTIRKNPHLKVFAANGIFDLATPFTSTEWELAHMGTDAKMRANVTWGYYPSGHMVYLNVDALRAFRQDLGRFYDSAK